METPVAEPSADEGTPRPMTPDPFPWIVGRVASRAESIVDNLQETHYTHVEHIDVAAGVYDCDCSGFVGFVLQEVAPTHYGLIPFDGSEPRPRAFEYYDFFSSLTPESTGGWHQIDFLRDARRGDIMAWRLPEIQKGHDTGHVFFVAETPAMIDPGTFAVRVYDSARIPHYDDTRGNEAGEPASGVGTGFINFKVDDAGRPARFQFGPTEPDFVKLPIAVGRIEPLP